MVDASWESRKALVVVRWVLIAVCAGLILFSGSMAGRVGFGALLLLAILLGRFAGRRQPRVLTTADSLPSRPEPSAEPPQVDVPRRETGH